MKSRKFLWVIVILIMVSLWIDLPKLPLEAKIPFTNLKISEAFNKFPLKLGLDLQGGTELVLMTDMSKTPADQKDNALESARQVIEKRINPTGVAETLVQSSKVGDQSRILVEIPGIQDASEAAALVGKPARLDFRELPATPSAEATQSAVIALYESIPTNLTGADLKKTEVVFNSSKGTRGGPQISLQFNDEGAKKFAEITRRNVGKPLAIFLDDSLLQAPTVSSEIIGGNAVITGEFTVKAAKQIVDQLNGGVLPVPVHIIEQRSVGASLGNESIQRSIFAGIIGLSLVMIFMAAYYGVYGLIADAALILYSLMVLAIFKTGLFLLPPVTLTLAGIAGFILSIGMAVDANILIFERMKEEKRSGNSSRTALELGFKRAWSSIRDSNTSSLITAGILYAMGTALIRGFATTLAIGVLVSMFTAITITRTLLRILIRR